MVKRRGHDIEKLWAVVALLVTNSALSARYRLHQLSGEYAGCLECHIEPDWLLIWEPGETLLLLRTGTHSDLF